MRKPVFGVSDTNWAIQLCNFGLDCTIFVAKTKVLIGCAVTAQLICTFVFAFAKNRFSHVTAYIEMHSMLLG